MSLEALDAQLEGLRSQAAGIQQDFNRTAKQIDADPNLTDEGKRNERKRFGTEAQERTAALRDKELSLIKGHIRTLETKLDAKIGYGATDLIAFRDAQERAERIESAEAADRSMSQALRSNDRTLAHAVFRKAMEKGWRSTVDQFAQENPESAAAAKDISVLEDNLRNGGLARGMSYMISTRW
ncbi:hypothetical protein [Curtobacterium sp. GD1]|uniref:hypothetical protein n=1 Tax=Curtobacterium sp. GD1 TaxID=2810612 RepID=UPI001E54C473|nr:hypothetical protein [Curtobacterium sp. GD1]MCC8909464.1 hypothetical protein [Curtobacterium sp. GD1]